MHTIPDLIKSQIGMTLHIQNTHGFVNFRDHLALSVLWNCMLILAEENTELWTDNNCVNIKESTLTTHL
jgi:hypothetical protein